jgi:hypothetical protein
MGNTDSITTNESEHSQRWFRDEQAKIKVPASGIAFALPLTIPTTRPCGMWRVFWFSWNWHLRLRAAVYLEQQHPQHQLRSCKSELPKTITTTKPTKTTTKLQKHAKPGLSRLCGDAPVLFFVRN